MFIYEEAELVWLSWRRTMSCAPARIQTPDCPPGSLVTILNTLFRLLADFSKMRWPYLLLEIVAGPGISTTNWE
jgi:hypothetical protein